jgi:proline iminopeptidase
MRTFFPPIEPYNSGYLQVDAEHSIYFEESGNPKGKPVVFLHGGPGAGTDPYHRTYFDPEFYRIILFDQRGAGKSRPHASLNDNTTWDLIRDIERIREKLKVDKWLVFGGSWGSTLSLAYGIEHPDRCVGLILRGIFLCRKKEINWFYQFGAHHIFPEEFERYISVIPHDERNNLLEAFYKRLTSDSPEMRLKAAKAWSRWEGSTLALVPNEDLITKFSGDHMALSLARIECHYFMNNAFFKSPNWILENVERIRKARVPGAIIHGRYDVVCPVENAWELSKAWPEATLQIIKDAGHAAGEPGIVDALISSTEKFKKYF